MHYTDEWKLTINSVDEIVIKIAKCCGCNLPVPNPDKFHPVKTKRNMLEIYHSEKQNSTCSKSKTQEKSTQTECSKELNPIEVTTIEEGKQFSKNKIRLEPNNQKFYYREDYVWETVSIKQKDILNNLKQLYGTQSC